MAGPVSTRSAAQNDGALLPLTCPLCTTRYPAHFKVCPRDAARLENGAAPEDPLIGALLGQTFRVLRVLGEGGTARVYEAQHARLSPKRFAVKVLHSSYASQTTIVARFYREAEAAAGIDHPNVVDVYDVDRTSDGRPYIVSEFLEGTELGSLLKQQPHLEVEFAVRVVREICAALGAAHAKNVVHRDLKPENVFLSGTGANVRVKVLDFGISKVLDSAAEALTRTGMVVGTPAYMSPEQASGAVVDARTDVYGAGAILYRLVTGKPAFSGGDTTEVLSAVLTEEPRRPRSVRAGIPEGLELVIQRAMAKSPKNRYATMQELDTALVPFDTALLSSLTSPLQEATANVRVARVASETSITAALSQTAAQAAREVRRARPNIVIYSLLCYVWFLGPSIDAVVAVLSAESAPNESVAMTRLAGAAAGVALVLLGPLMLWIRHVSKQWKNSHSAIDLATLTRRVAVSAIVSYAGAVLALRLLMATTGQGGLDSTSPRVSLSLLLATFAGASAAHLWTRWRQRAESDS
ncbi:MAG TPA: serine/threonine-protein kinase [Polyangiaceae bacterium]|nr:serine/threonine-protein kinase [Polyangiaceae bacterium]